MVVSSARWQNDVGRSDNSENPTVLKWRRMSNSVVSFNTLDVRYWYLNWIEYFYLGLLFVYYTEAWCISDDCVAISYTCDV